MNDNFDIGLTPIPGAQIDRFQELITRLFQCCQDRMQYQSERFGLPDAELRCLLLFADARYLTSKEIAHKQQVVKSRVTKITEGLLRKGLIQKIKDPEDSRIVLLSLTAQGQRKIDEISGFLGDLHRQTLAQIPERQRTSLLTSLEMLKTALESVREELG